MHIKRLGIALTLTAIMLVPWPAAAETPLTTAFTYQGQLKNSGSAASGSFNMVFQLFDALTLGNQVGPTLTFDGAGGNPPLVSVTDGLFTVPIDFGSAAFGGNKRWLSITVGGTTLTPRQELTAAPNALNADKLDGLNSSAFLQSIPVPLTLTGTINTHIIRAENASTGFLPTAIYGNCTGATGGTTGVRGDSASTNGRGVIGFATAATGTTYGGQFESASPDGRGVYGGANFGTGVYGESAFADGVYGIGHYGGRFESASNGTGVSGTGFVGVRGSGFIGGEFESTTCVGIGVKGVATCGTDLATGVVGESHSVSGRGVTGYATASTGTNNGVYGTSASPSGRGVYGNSTDNIGVFGEAEGTTGSNFGVYGESKSTTGLGVNGVASAGSGVNYGVRGATASGSGYGVYSSGDFGASGTKAFRIDHPLDPENKYLLHYAAESPMPQNFYCGNVVTDARGEAWVELPGYFAEINTNFKYQLTVVDGPSSGENDFVQVKVRQKIKDGRFFIRTSAPNVDVSWEIKADRNDLYVRRKQPKDVVEKQDAERGTYQHPELYGQPPEKGMNYDAACASPAPPDAPNATSH